MHTEYVDLSPEAAAERAQAIISEWQVGGQHSTLVEALASIDRALRLEDENWDFLLGVGNSDNTGPDFAFLHEESRKIRFAILKSPIMKRALRLRQSYTWSKGITLPELKAPEVKPGPRRAQDRTAASAAAAFVNPVNQAAVFSDIAHEELETAAFCDGTLALLADDTTKELRRVPFCDIDGVVTNPDFPDEVWAYRRNWNSIDPSGKAKQIQRWYYVDTYTGTKRTQIQNVAVDQKKTLIVASFNRLLGWPLGIPDAVNVIAWAKLYSEFLKHGYVMSKALASFAFKASAATKKAAENATAKFAAPAGAGQTAVMGGLNDLTPLASAGKGYDFASGRALASMVATGVEISLIHLLSDPGAAGSSYGSASNLDLPTKRAIVSRQRVWVDFYKRVLTYIGVTDPTVEFPSLEDPDFYRETQSLVLGWNTGALSAVELRTRLLNLLNILGDAEDVPDGIMLPNNVDSINRLDNDGGDTASTPSSTAAPDQGKSNKAGKGAGAGDIRSRGVGSNSNEMLNHMETQRLLQELLETVGNLSGA